MADIQIKKRTLYIFLAVIIFGSFIFFAAKSIVAKDADNALTGELVKGGTPGLNNVQQQGNSQVVNLGVANYNYDPSVIEVEAGKPVRIIGNTDQLRGCLRAFTIPQLGIRKVFSGNDNILEFTPTQKGSFKFSCSMGMGYGTLRVK